MVLSFSVRAVMAVTLTLALLLVSRFSAWSGTEKAEKSSAGSQESPVRETTENMVVMKDEEDRYEVVATLGELTVHHAFKGRSRVTIHEVFFASYPRVFFQEVYNVPLAEVKKDSDRFLQGFDGTLRAKMLSAIYRELSPLFGDETVRRLPPPDERIITGMRLAGEDFLQNIHIEVAGGRWVPLTDTLLIKIIRSEPAPLYAITDEEEIQ